MDKSYPKWTKVMSIWTLLLSIWDDFIHLGAIGRGALNAFTIETQIGAVWLLNY